MNATLAVPLVAALVAVATGTVIVALNPRARANRIGALLMGSIAWWAACEVLSIHAADAAAASTWYRIATPGFVFLGAHVAWFSESLREGEPPRLARWVPALYALNAVFGVLVFTGPWMLAGMERGRFGWAPEPGPLLPIWLTQTALVVGLCLLDWVRADRSASEPVARLGAARWSIGVGIAAACVALGDLLLVAIDADAPRASSLAISLLGLTAILLLSHPARSRLNAAGIAQEILRELPDGVAVVHQSGRIQLSNPAMAALLACGDEPIEGRVLTDERLELPVLDAGVEYRAHECELLQDSGFRIPVSVSTTPLRSVAGVDPQMLLIVRDVREVAALRSRLATSERLAVVGQLAGGIAHEINNPLAFVRANLHHFHRELGALSEKAEAGTERVCEVVAELDEVVSESLEGIERAMQIVRDVNTFSDAGGDAYRLVDVGELMRQAVDVVRLGLPDAVRVVTGEMPPDGLEVKGSPQRLKHLFLNLLVNAVQAVGDAGAVNVEVRRDRRRVYVSVTDDGAGICPEDLARVFDPFFTTRPVGLGTGLGLAVCHEITRTHGGSIDVKSEVGRGTRVAVTLPAVPRQG